MDLVPSAIGLAWKDKITQTYNLDNDDKAKVHVLFFTSYKNSLEFKEGIKPKFIIKTLLLINDQSFKIVIIHSYVIGVQKKKPRCKLKMAAEAAESLLKECKSIIEKYQAKSMLLLNVYSKMFLYFHLYLLLMYCS